MSRLLRRGAALLPVSRKLVQNARYAGTALERAATYQPGQTLHGYTINQVTPVPELYLTAVTLTHDKTGAEHLHVARDDSDNAFGVAFKTTPMDSTGVPHILEHTALCGSRRYPVRDPFFKMLNRSLSTFMNAFTANDWTMYPFSTQNKRDYANLLGVYLDAAFFPQLREQDFRQEGWRLEHEVTEDAKSPIIFKGIVFNEMKGVFSNSQQLFTERMQNLLLPSHTYSVCSGGDPRNIPDLTWQQLRTFHQSHYHPSNSRFYTYGDLPLEDHLDRINKQALETFDTIDPGTDVPLETRWTEPREAEMTCALNSMAPDPNKQTTVAVTYLLADVTDTFESFMLSFVSSLLTMGETAPFYATLIQPNIGSDYAPGLGYNGYTREASFSVGLEGIHKDDVAKVKNIIEETLDQVINEGFEEERIEMLLHKIEISQRHVYNNFGLHLGVNLISSWNHGAEVTELLQTNESVARLKEEMRQNPQYLQHKVKQYFKDNKHKLSLVMSPDEGFEQRRQEEEQQRLAALIDQLTEADKQKIYQEGLALAAQQNAEEDLSCLPSLQVSDIERTLPPVTLSTSYTHGIPIQVSEQPTNGLTFFRSICNMRDLDEQLKPYVPLFCGVVTKMGAGTMDYRQLSQQIELKTGSFGASPLISDHHSDSGVYEEGVLFSSYCLDRNVEDMFELWSEIFQRLDLSDMDRLQTLTMMSAADLAQSLSGSGHAYAMGHSASTLTPSAMLKETLSGMSQVALMKTVAEMTDMKPVLSHLKDISAHLLNRKNMRVSINATPDSMPSVVKETEKFIGALRGDKKPVTMETNTKAGHFDPRQSQTHFELPFQVNYASRSVLTVPYTNTDFASLRVLARIMTNKYLHREIREKGGAYGGGASSNSAGILSFYSYRDPNSMTTLSAFDGAVDWALSGNFTQQDIDEAKLSIFQKVDGPVPPGDRGLREFVSGIDDARRDAHREQLFAVTKDDLVTAADRYLSTSKRTSAVTLLGPKNPATENSTDWKVKTQNQ